LNEGAARLELGYGVHLIDPVPRLLEEARRSSAGRARPVATFRVGGRKAMLGTARALETEPTLLGVSAHLLAAGRGPRLARFTAPRASG
jgi:hypothetical protein